MAEQQIETTKALQIDAETYLEHFAEHRYEWVNGALLKISPVSLDHTHIVKFLMKLLDAYLSIMGIGQVEFGPYVMRLANSFREPDLMIILNDNPAELSKRGLLGPADICIEVVSEGNSNVDYGDKYTEYEAAGVREYWIIDPIRRQAIFHRCNDDTQRYEIAAATPARYETPLLPHFWLDVPTLWQPQLPDFWDIAEQVKGMLPADNDEGAL